MRDRMCLSMHSFLSLDADDDETVGTHVAEDGKCPWMTVWREAAANLNPTQDYYGRAR